MSKAQINAAAVRRALRALSDAAGAFGGHCEDDSGADVCLQVCAPAGKVWNASDGQHIVVCTSYGPQSWLDSAVEDGLSRIAEGVRDGGEA